MLYYRDRTFCASDCENKDCARYYSDEVRNEAIRLEMAVSKGNFAERCDAYQPPKEKK